MLFYEFQTQEWETILTTTQEELIRHRIEKRMAGRRDLFLHALVFILVMVLIRFSLPWWDVRALALFGGFWAIPLALNALRYYYQCGPGLRKRAQAIEREFERYDDFTDLEEEEEVLIEERVARRFKAGRLVMAHLLVMSSVLAILWVDYSFMVQSVRKVSYGVDLTNATQAWGLVIVAHWLRFIFVHGRGPAGRALSIEREIERQWHLARSRRRERQQIFEDEDDHEDAVATVDLERVRAGQSLVTDDGELIGEPSLLDAVHDAGALRKGATR